MKYMKDGLNVVHTIMPHGAPKLGMPPRKIRKWLEKVEGESGVTVFVVSNQILENTDVVSIDWDKLKVTQAKMLRNGNKEGHAIN